MSLTKNIIEDVLWLQTQCSLRKITYAAKWAAEILFYLPAENAEIQSVIEEKEGKIWENVANSKYCRMALVCMECQEFDRASYFLTLDPEQNPFVVFMKLYAKYVAGEKKRLDNMADVTDKGQSFENESIEELRIDLNTLDQNGQLDGFLYYLYGLVLLNQCLHMEARNCFEKSINLLPAFWPSWLEMTKLIDSKYQLKDLDLPDHWLKTFFLAEVYQRLQDLTLAIDHYQSLIDGGFGELPYIVGQIAAARNGLQEHELAVEGFQRVHEMDPYRVEQMDLYSNSLYVRQMRLELANLAHYFFDINKFCPETCCIVGNYYGLRGEHERAALYFQRALKLEPRNAGAWILVGHEFMELKNISAACLAYHNALEIDKKDYRGWYALGQMYDIVRNHSYSLYYYQRAQMCRPNDSRMMIAVGDTYLKMNNRVADAQKCFWKAHIVGDIEGTALVRLGKSFERQEDLEQAASCFMKYLKQLERQELEDDDNQCYCYRFLAKYCLDLQKLDEAHYFAQFCLDYDATKEDGKSYLKKIAQNRQRPSTSTNVPHVKNEMQVDQNLTTPK